MAEHGLMLRFKYRLITVHFWYAKRCFKTDKTTTLMQHLCFVTCVTTSPLSRHKLFLLVSVQIPLSGESLSPSKEEEVGEGAVHFDL